MVNEKKQYFVFLFYKNPNLVNHINTLKIIYAYIVVKSVYKIGQ